jgi:plastocyanin
MTLRLGTKTLIPVVFLFGTLLSGCGKSPVSTSEAGVDANTGPSAADIERTDPRDNPRQQSAPRPADVTVRIDNFTFGPAELTIPAGTKVTWVNHDDVPHTATSNSKPRLFDSKTLDTDEEFSFVFTAPGTYDYFCALHKHMTARITVK